MECEQSSRCTRGEAVEFRLYKKKRNVILKKNYFCDYIGGRCKLNNCSKYLVCTREEKKNFHAWEDAYEKDKRAELERLSKGGV